VAPILLYTLNLPVPQDLEGRVAELIFHPDILHQRPLRLGGLTRSPKGQPLKWKTMARRKSSPA
jgi:hypothetical protein